MRKRVKGENGRHEKKKRSVREKRELHMEYVGMIFCKVLFIVIL
jgi:hypothetical protein